MDRRGQRAGVEQTLTIADIRHILEAVAQASR